MYKCKYFKISELVHPDLLKQHGEDRCWLFFDERLLRFIDWAREKWGAILINGSGLKDCGARKIESNTGAGMSAHKFWRAFDLHIMDIERRYGSDKTKKANEYAKIRKEILNHPEWPFICMETHTNGKAIWWLHVDTYNRPAREFKA